MVTESRPNSVGEAQGTVVGVPVGSVSAGSAAGGKIGDVNAFWREVLFTRVKDARALNEVRAHRAQIFQELRNVVFSDEESAKLRQKPFSDWVCEVMTALGADAPPDEQEQAIIDKLNASREAEERQVGIAFAHIAEVLPPALLNWTEVFRVKPSSSAKEREYFGSDASAEQARELLPEVIDRLIAYHLTPRLIFLAARGIAMLIHRLVDRDMLAIVPDVFLVANQNVPDQTTRARTLPYAMAVSEIEAMTRCSQSTAQDLYVWLIRVSPYVTQLFPGFGVTEKFADVAKAPTLDRVALGAAPSEDMPILEQWKPRANLAKQPATAPAAAGASAKNAPARPAVAREKHQI